MAAAKRVAGDAFRSRARFRARFGAPFRARFGTHKRAGNRADGKAAVCG